MKKKNLIEIIKNYIKSNLFKQQDLLMYLCGGSALPKALKDDEEKFLINELGDINRDVAKQKLIEHNLRLVVYIAKKFESSNVDIEDLISIGSFGLIKAVNSFKSDKNIKIATYASKCIENEILMYLRKIAKQKNEVSLDEPLNIDTDGNELLLFDLMPSESSTPQGEMELNTEKKILWDVINSLNKREREIMLMRFGLNGDCEKTQKEVADILSISQSYISRLEKRTVNKIKKEINKISAK